MDPSSSAAISLVIDTLAPNISASPSGLIMYEFIVPRFRFYFPWKIGQLRALEVAGDGSESRTGSYSSRNLREDFPVSCDQEATIKPLKPRKYGKVLLILNPIVPNSQFHQGRIRVDADALICVGDKEGNLISGEIEFYSSKDMPYLSHHILNSDEVTEPQKT